VRRWCDWTDNEADQTRYARRSAEAFINKERSRFFVRGEISGNFAVHFFAQNKGLSPARVTYGFVGCEIFSGDEKFKEVPDYTGGDPEWVFSRNEWILPDQEGRIGNYDAGFISEVENPELFAWMMGREHKVWFYGVVRYSDSVSQRGHEVRFCYETLIRDDGSLVLFKSGSEAYRREK